MATATSSDPRRDKDTNVLNRSGLNPRRACIKRALTSSACVCKPAAAKLTNTTERSQAWHSSADWMRRSPSSASTSASDPAEICACGACIMRGTRHAMRHCCACRGRELHAPSASCCVCACTVTVPVLDGPVCAARARSHRALRPTERRLQSVAAARRQGRRWRRTKVPWA